MPAPRADFCCLSKSCTEEGAALVYELPVDATHCPKGHKRLRRIWTPPHISTGVAKQVDTLVEPGYTAQKEVQASRHPAVVAAHASQLGPALAKATGMPAFGAASAGPNKPANPTGAVLGSAFPQGGPPVPGLKRPRPAPGSPAWSGR